MHQNSPPLGDVSSPKVMMRASAEGREALHQKDGNLPDDLAPTSPTSSTPLTRSPYAASVAIADGAARRRAAADWIEGITGAHVPSSSEEAFRGALKDGVLVCRIANSIWPGIIPRVVESLSPDATPTALTRQRADNIAAFTKALDGLLPSDCLFTTSDLEAEGLGPEEKPVVANAMLVLKGLADAGAIPRPVPLRSPRSRDHGPSSSRFSAGVQQQLALLQARMTPRGSYSRPSTAASELHASSYTAEQGFSGAAAALQRFAPAPGPLAAAGMGAAANGSSMPSSSMGGSDSLKAAQSKSVQAAAGVTRLMQQCTAMLRERMFVDGPAVALAHRPPPPRYGQAHAPVSDGSALEAISPVLENVLSSLTTDYEKRLLKMDHELSAAKASNTGLQRKVVALEAEVTQLRLESDARGAEAAAAAAAEAGRDAARLKEELAAAQAALREREAALESLNAAADSSSKTRAVRELQLREQLEAAAQKLAGLHGIEERYGRAVEENRQLYNMVQDLRGNIRVFCRIRPPGVTGDTSPSCIDVGLEGDLAVYDISRPNGERRTFKVDRVYEADADQATIYDDTQPLIRSVLDGYNVCIFAYGQTGSGKTHTMSGSNPREPEGRGINYRALDDLFAIRDQRRDQVDYSLRVQMLEIYNESLRDLLLDSPAHGTKLDILSTQASGCNVPGATQFNVTNAHDVAALMARGAANRHTSETKMNDRSSRSHQILTVIVDGVDAATGAKSHGCLHLIDLAGSERVGKSEASGDRLVEAQHINRSLSALGDVMAALASKDKHIPFRNSKLTQLLQDSLSGQAKVMMFMHISPEVSMHGESASTLTFAKRVAEITLGQAKRNVESSKVFEAHEHVAQARAVTAQRESAIRELNAALAAERSQLSVVMAERDALAREAYEIRHQLEAAKKAALLASMQYTSRAASNSAGTPGSATVAASGGRVPRLALEKAGLIGGALRDRSPQRDQDSEDGKEEAAPLHYAGRLQLGDGTGNDGSRTPRSHRTPARTNSSSRHHIDRLSSARKSTAMPAQALVAAAAAALAGGSSTRVGAAGFAALSSQRSRTDIGVPSSSRANSNPGNIRTREPAYHTSRQLTAPRPSTASSTASVQTGSPAHSSTSAAPNSSRQTAFARAASTSRWK